MKIETTTNKLTVSTLGCPALTSERLSGNSTRQIDYAIQMLFAGNIVKVQDHAKNGGDRRANEMLNNNILSRLTHEYPHISEDRIRVERPNQTIELL